MIPSAFLNDLIINNYTPSVQYLTFNEDRLLSEFRKGHSDLRKKEKVTAGTLFPVFSITKTFTALAILQLAERRLIELAAPAGNYLRELPLQQSVTVKNLLSHTSGLNNPLPINWIHTEADHSGYPGNRFFNPILLKSIEKSGPPGRKFSYSNLGFVILGQIIESVTGKSYEEYVTNNILDHLTLDDDMLTFRMNGSFMCTGYHKSTSISMILLRMMMDTRKYMGHSEGKWKPFRPVYVNGTAYGGLFANTGGMVRYGQELLRNRSSLLSGESRTNLFTENRTDNGKPTGMCLSWFKGTHKGQVYYSHAGGGGGFYSELRLYPDLKRGSFIILNRSGFSDKRLLDRLDEF